MRIAPLLLALLVACPVAAREEAREEPDAPVAIALGQPVSVHPGVERIVVSSRFDVATGMGGLEVRREDGVGAALFLPIDGDASQPGIDPFPDAAEFAEVFALHPVELLDANFDGYLDLTRTLWQAAANSARDFWLYQPESGGFAFHAGLADLTSPVVFPEAHRVRSMSVDGTVFDVRFHRWEGDRLERVPPYIGDAPPLRSGAGGPAAGAGWRAWPPPTHPELPGWPAWGTVPPAERDAGGTRFAWSPVSSRAPIALFEDGGDLEADAPEPGWRERWTRVKPGAALAAVSTRGAQPARYAGIVEERYGCGTTVGLALFDAEPAPPQGMLWLTLAAEAGDVAAVEVEALEAASPGTRRWQAGPVELEWEAAAGTRGLRARVPGRDAAVVEGMAAELRRASARRPGLAQMLEEPSFAPEPVAAFRFGHPAVLVLMLAVPSLEGIHFEPLVIARDGSLRTLRTSYVYLCAF